MPSAWSSGSPARARRRRAQSYSIRPSTPNNCPARSAKYRPRGCRNANSTRRCSSSVSLRTAGRAGAPPCARPVRGLPVPPHPPRTRRNSPWKADHHRRRQVARRLPGARVRSIDGGEVLSPAPGDPQQLPSRTATWWPTHAPSRVPAWNPATVGKRTLALPAELVPELEIHLDKWALPVPRDWSSSGKLGPGATRRLAEGVGPGPPVHRP
jgi:hypothetical protein